MGDFVTGVTTGIPWNHSALEAFSQASSTYHVDASTDPPMTQPKYYSPSVIYTDTTEPPWNRLLNDTVTREVDVGNETFTASPGVDLLMVYAVSYILDVYANVVVGVVGVVSNTLAAIMLWSRARKASTFNYLFGLAVTDLVYLTTSVLLGLLDMGFGVNLNLVLTCPLVHALLTSGQLSSWLLVLCCAERVIVSYAPTRAQEWLTPCNARVTIVAVTMVILVSNGHILLLTTDGGPRQPAGPLLVCVGRTPGLTAYHRHLYGLISASLYSFLPGCCLFVTNAMIVIRLCRRDNRVGPETTSAKVIRKNAERLTKVAVGLTAIFVCSTVPMAGCVVMAAAVGVERAPGGLAGFYVAMKLFNSVSLLNHCVNLILYMTYSRGMRAHLRKMFTSRCKQNAQGDGGREALCICVVCPVKVAPAS